MPAAVHTDVVIEIGGLPISLRSEDPAFLQLLEERYAGFLGRTRNALFDLDIDLAPIGWTAMDPEENVRVDWSGGRWSIERGDFHAEWDPASARGRIRQTSNPYSVDSVLRILHSLLLAKAGGFLVHAASAVRDGRAFLFAGPSGAGKTTIARLAPPGTTILTDEISYVTKENDEYYAFGTPFAGELARVGENLRAPIECLCLLAKGLENKIEPVSPAEAARDLLANILFFAHDAEFVHRVFQAACDFANRVPVRRLTFAPDASVWELIQ